MKTIIEKWIKEHGYKPFIEELYCAYTSGYLQLTDAEEDALVKFLESKGFF